MKKSQQDLKGLIIRRQYDTINDIYREVNSQINDLKKQEQMLKELIKEE